MPQQIINWFLYSENDALGLMTNGSIDQSFSVYSKWAYMKYELHILNV